MKSPDKKKEIIHKYNSTAHFYNERYKEIQLQKFKRVIKKDLIKDKIILDAGCGTGLLFQYIIEKFLHKNKLFFNYIGVDISWEMVRIFKNNRLVKNENAKKKINILLADLEHLPFKDSSYDCLFAFTSLQNLPDIFKGLEESLRILKDHSYFCLSILRKKINKDELLNFINTYTMDFSYIDNNALEDIIFQGNALKKKKTFKNY